MPDKIAIDSNQSRYSLALGDDWTSAIKPIFAIFWDFDGVGQVIATKLLTRRVWIILAGRKSDRF
jgi:hypothetical protein